MHYQEFVSQEEVEHILQLCEGRWERSMVTSGKASSLLGASAGKADEGAALGKENVGETRTSDSVYLTFDESYVVERIAARVAHVTGYSLEHVEPMVALRYGPGQFFKMHHDGAMRPATVFIYLNGLDEDGGGQTSFPHLGFQVQPVARTAVMWKNRLPNGSADQRLNHEAKPVAKGVKYAMNCFVNAQPQRDTDHIVVKSVPAVPEQQQGQREQHLAQTQGGTTEAFGSSAVAS